MPRAKFLPKTICNQSLLDVTSFLSRTYGLLPCFCHFEPKRMSENRSAMFVSNSSNAFWNRSKRNRREEKQQNNSKLPKDQPETSGKFRTFRQSISKGFRRKKKKTITARSVPHPRTKKTPIKRRSSTVQQKLTSEKPFSISTSSSQFVQNDDDLGLPPSSSVFKNDYQNVNATNNPSRTLQNSSHGQRSASTKKINGRSPFADPDLFHSLPPLHHEEQITKANVHENHLCCKSISAVKNLSSSDQKKLIEHDYLTLISLLPIYLGSQGRFEEKIREKTHITHEAAIELERLMNEWGSARLFIGTQSPIKTLTQTI